MFVELGALVDATPVECVSVSDGVWSLLSAAAASLPARAGGDGLVGEPINVVPASGPAPPLLPQPPFRAHRLERLFERAGETRTPLVDVCHSPGGSASGRAASIAGLTVASLGLGPRPPPLASPEERRAVDAALHGYIPETVVQHLKASHQVEAATRHAGPPWMITGGHIAYPHRTAWQARRSPALPLNSACTWLLSTSPTCPSMFCTQAWLAENRAVTVAFVKLPTLGSACFHLAQACAVQARSASRVRGGGARRSRKEPGLRNGPLSLTTCTSQGRAAYINNSGAAEPSVAKVAFLSTTLNAPTFGRRLL